MTAAELRALLRAHARDTADVVELPMVQPLGAGGLVRLQHPGGGTVVASSGAPFAPGARLPVARVEGAQRLVTLPQTTPASEGASTAPPLRRRGTLQGLRGAGALPPAAPSSTPALLSQAPDPAVYSEDPPGWEVTVNGSGFDAGTYGSEWSVQPMEPGPEAFDHFGVQVVSATELLVQVERQPDEANYRPDPFGPFYRRWAALEVHVQVAPVVDPFAGGSGAGNSWAERVAYVEGRPDALILRFAEHLQELEI